MGPATLTYATEGGVARRDRKGQERTETTRAPHSLVDPSGHGDGTSGPEVQDSPIPDETRKGESVSREWALGSSELCELEK